MEKQFEILKTIRQNFLKLVEEPSVEQLNFVPSGFNNNIVWNLGHIVVTQQLLQYKLSNVEVKVSDELIQRFRKGTKPEAEVSKQEIDDLKSLLVQNVAILIEDYQKGIFKEYSVYQTSFGVELKNIEDAVAFNNAHETLHLGYAMALKKCLK
jgi:hypothetical protein